jgi:hypothetical protein
MGVGWGMMGWGGIQTCWGRAIRIPCPTATRAGVGKRWRWEMRTAGMLVSLFSSLGTVELR